jgi:hypothetical protein
MTPCTPDPDFMKPLALHRLHRIAIKRVHDTDRLSFHARLPRWSNDRLEIPPLRGLTHGFLRSWAALFSCLSHGLTLW